MEYLSEDKRTIKLPVPLGSIVYEAVTKCGDFCLFQERKFDSIFPKNGKDSHCGKEKPCHTISRGCKELPLTLNNLGAILEDWDVWYFATKKEAEEASAKIAAEHAARMKELGFFVRDDGYGKTADADEE